MTCIECGSHNMEHHQGYRAERHHPGEPAGWECLDCGHFETEWPNDRADAMADDDRDRHSEYGS